MAGRNTFVDENADTRLAGTLTGEVDDAAAVGGVAVTGTPSAGDVPTAVSAVAATWQPPGASISAWGEASTAQFAGSGSPVGVVTPTSEGDLYVDDTTPGLWQATGATSADWQQVGAGAAGAARVLGPFLFAFDDPGLEDGIAFYTPTVGDILLDAWVEIDTAFDGTTPQADVGQFDGVTYGIWGGNTYAMVISSADDEQGQGPGLLTFGHRERPTATLSNATEVGDSFTPFRQIPAKFTAATPLKVVVSQDGAAGGTVVGGTAGAGAVYLVVATPSLT